MTSWKNAALWLAVFACVGGVGWALGEWDGTPSRALVDAQHDAPPAPTFRIAQGPGPQPIALDAAMARHALRDGELRVALPDGSTYPVRMERQDTDGTGHWNVIGRVQTALGPQAMVLTFGPDAVFGVVPLPDGRLMQVTTGPGGKVSIAPAGRTVPESQRGMDVATPDFIAAPRATPPVPRIETVDRPGSGVRGFVADQSMPVTGLPSASSTDRLVARAAPGTSLVTINVLAYYAPDLVTLRGTADAAKTEIAHLFAVANQAHIDSGSRVRLNAVAMLPLEVSITDNNSDLLSEFTGSLQFNAEKQRDTYAADLVTLVRPYHPGDSSCGVAYLAGASLHRSSELEATYGYSVVDVAPCGPFVLAHEIGHLLGSTHDRKTVKDSRGELEYGAFAYSFGNRTPTFATVMAYELAQPEVGYFSNPLNSGCGDWCGVENRSDNVQSFARMAEAIAAYRGPTGTVSIAPAERLEPEAGDVTGILVPIRLSMPAPQAGLAFTVQVVGGTATEGVDYTLYNGNTATATWDSRVAWLPIQVLGDDLVEGDETIVLRITGPAGTPVANDTATITIDDDDPRLVLQGKLVFPDGAALPTSPVEVELRNIDGEDDMFPEPRTVQAMPPSFEFPMHVAAGSPMTVLAKVPAPFVSQFVPVEEASTARVLEVPVLRGQLIGGYLRVPAGGTVPNYVMMDFSETSNNVMRQSESLVVPGPGYSWTRWVMPGSQVKVSTWSTFEYARYEAVLSNVRTDMALDMPLSTRPTVYPWGFPKVTEGAQGGMVIQLSAPAPAGGVSVHYAAIDGTAKVNQDFAPMSGTVLIPQGQSRAIVDFRILADGVAEPQEYFTFAIDNAVGAQISVSSMRIEIATSRRTGTPQAPVR